MVAKENLAAAATVELIVLPFAMATATDDAVDAACTGSAMATATPTDPVDAAGDG